MGLNFSFRSKIALLLIVGVMAGCHREDTSSKAGEVAGGEAKAPAAETDSQPSDTDSTLIEKINGYVACLNRTAPRASDSRRQYLSWANESTGPTCTEPYIAYGIYGLYSDGIQLCHQAATQGKSLAPALPQLDQAMEDLSKAYAELMPLTQKAADYYQQQDYKDDQCAGGKTMHTQLMLGFNRFFSAEKIASAELDKVKDQLDEKELVSLEQEQGKKLPWQKQYFMMKARALLRTMPQGSGEIDASAYGSAFDGVETAYQQFIEYASAHTQETSETFFYSAFESSLKNFYTKAKFLKRDLSEGKKPEAQVLNDWIEAYNRMVGDANSLTFKSN